MNFKHIFTKARRPLLVSIALAVLLIFSAQAACAGGFTVDLKVDPTSVSVNSTTTVTMYVHDTDQPTMKFKGALVNLTVIHPSGSVEYFEKSANDSGMFTLPFKATEAGTYTFQAKADYVYTGQYGLPAGMASDTSDMVMLTSKAGINFPGGIVRPTNFVIITPVANATPTAQAATPTPSQATPTPQAGTPTPVAGTSDVVAPVTTLNLTGNATGAGEYTGDVVCALAARDNEGGSDVTFTQYSFDGSSWFLYQQPFSVVKPGMTTVYYRSVDNAGNVEVANVKAIVIAEAAQVPTATPSPSPSATAQATPGFAVSITAIALIGLAAVLLIAGSSDKK
ncbi:OmpL47-type beta-barrel domain-containing protein [Methanocella sp. MCL-LM]|uniref:OmpL47-type beta-barrel domain-containing protein n=1 Tax=Methanocella sp. MCL-LM TaxID=3412035 RepID=UPI003C754A65